MEGDPPRRLPPPPAAVAHLLRRQVLRLPAQGRQRPAQPRARSRRVRCVLSYLWVRIRPPKDQTQLRGVDRGPLRLAPLPASSSRPTPRRCGACRPTEIPADWAAQRIKNLSLGKAVWRAFFPGRGKTDITSLIEEFDYPKFGPGQMWERCTELVTAAGSTVEFDAPVARIRARRRPRRRRSSPPTGGRCAVHRGHLVDAARRARARHGPAGAGRGAGGGQGPRRTATSSSSPSSCPRSSPSPTTGSTSTSPACSSVASRTSARGRRTWSRTAAPASASSTSCSRATSCGRAPTTSSSSWAPRELAQLGLVDRRPWSRPATSCGCRRRIRSTTRPSPTTSRSAGRGSTTDAANVHPVGPQRHAPLQQPGPLDVHGDAHRREPLRRRPRRLGGQRRGGVPRGDRRRASGRWRRHRHRPVGPGPAARRSVTAPAATTPDRATAKISAVAIFLVSMAGLLLEVGYTRIVSYKLWYYYTYLVIGLALLGIGSGGIARGDLGAACAGRTDRRSSRVCSVAGAVSIAVGYLVIARLPIDTIAIWDYGTRASVREPRRARRSICFALFATFIALGVIVSTLLGRAGDERRPPLLRRSRRRRRSAASLAIPLITRLGPPQVVVARRPRLRRSSALLTIARATRGPARGSVALAGRRRRRRRRRRRDVAARRPGRGDEARRRATQSTPSGARCSASTSLQFAADSRTGCSPTTARSARASGASTATSTASTATTPTRARSPSTCSASRPSTS